MDRLEIKNLYIQRRLKRGHLYLMLLIITLLEKIFVGTNTVVHL